MIFEPQREWNCPEEFPDLNNAKHIAIDLETKDTELKSEDQEQYKEEVR
jgi:hypothetical protein